MPKLTTKAQKIFCGDVSPNNVVAVFGSNKAGSPAYSNDPDTIQSLDAWTNGWTGAVGTNLAPSIQDMNAFFYVASRQIAYLFQGGVGEWNADITYYIGSLVSDGAGTLYKSLVDDNINNALTDSTKWMNYSSNTSRDVSGNSYTVVNSDYAFTWPSGATGPSGTAYELPAASADNKGRRFAILDLHDPSTGTGQIIFSDGTQYLPESANVYS